MTRKTYRIDGRTQARLDEYRRGVYTYIFYCGHYDSALARCMDVEEAERQLLKVYPTAVEVAE